jgi:prepilin-type N-terminal cleavage/methylation domain-containing protein
LSSGFSLPELLLAVALLAILAGIALPSGQGGGQPRGAAGDRA